MFEQPKATVPNNPVEIMLKVDCLHKNIEAIRDEVFKAMSPYMTFMSFDLSGKRQIEFNVTLLNTASLGTRAMELVELFRPMISQRLSCISFNLVTETGLHTDVTSVSIF